MGNHRRPKSPSRARITAVAGLAGAASLLPLASAHAEPKPSIEQVKREVDQLHEDAESSTEKFNKAEEQQKQLQQDANTIQDRIARQQARISEMQTVLGGVAAEQYRSGGIDPSVKLMLSSAPDRYLQQASMADQATNRQVGTLRALMAEQRKLDQDRAEAGRKLAELERATVDARQRKAEVKEKLAKVQKLLGSLTAAERAQVNDDGTGKASRSSSRGQTYTGPATGQVKAVLDFAYAQLGKPYEWGATGPNSFDCSGLTQGAWRAGGVALPRVSQDQWNAGRHVAKSDLQPGDLVFYYSDLHHVGIYIGNGQLLHAPRTGKNVEIVGLDVMPYMGAVRP
ncbi:C40 family peptidase [Kitasatospora atroaurantiaca]|uniref:NlpC/P60 family protein n=1 Tax=Kitasatospora atroaurantiaca TaxID=285545 RepID=A0A561EXL9_9ACTN|nr:C40 family peptidase [Kitasatospora atroaurantiaca]TWE20358.1 NlpC/P60 family protein [Kitasatospora atroaurantiaca]